MTIVQKVVLGVLVFLACSSGFTKITLMQQDVEFFGQYGFTNPLLIAFGLAQLAGGIMMIPAKSRFIGALLVALTFIISAVVLLIAGSITLATITGVTLVLLGLVMRPAVKTEESTEKSVA